MHRATKPACLIVLATCAVLVVLATEGPLSIDFRSVRVTRPDLEFVGGSGMGEASAVRAKQSRRR